MQKLWGQYANTVARFKISHIQRQNLHFLTRKGCMELLSNKKKQLSRSPGTSGSSDPVLLFPLLSFLPGNSRMMSMLISVEVEIWAAGAPGLHHKLFPRCVCVGVRWDEQAHPH